MNERVGAREPSTSGPNRRLSAVDRERRRRLAQRGAIEDNEERLAFAEAAAWIADLEEQGRRNGAGDLV